MRRPARRFLFVLAGHLNMTVKQLCAEMDADELAEWMAFAGYEPIGDRRGDLQAAIAATAAFRALGANAKPDDFVPDFWASARWQGVNELQARLKMLVVESGGKVIEHGNNR